MATRRTPEIRVKLTRLRTVSIIITWAGQTPYDKANDDQQQARASFNVVSGPLKLEFGLLFL